MSADNLSKSTMKFLAQSVSQQLDHEINPAPTLLENNSTGKPPGTASVDLEGKFSQMPGAWNDLSTSDIKAAEEKIVAMQMEIETLRQKLYQAHLRIKPQIDDWSTKPKIGEQESLDGTSTPNYPKYKPGDDMKFLEKNFIFADARTQAQELLCKIALNRGLTQLLHAGDYQKAIEILQDGVGNIANDFPYLPMKGRFLFWLGVARVQYGREVVEGGKIQHARDYFGEAIQSFELAARYGVKGAYFEGSVLDQWQRDAKDLLTQCAAVEIAEARPRRNNSWLGWLRS